jgi:hypothetical protein
MNALLGTSVQMAASCGLFFALRQPGTNGAGTTSYYDATSSALVAVVDSNGDCLGGASDFAAPTAEACGFTPCGSMSCGGPPDSGM